MTVPFGLELLSSEANKLFLNDFIVMSDSASFFLGLIALASHGFDVHLERLSTLLEDSDLLTSRTRVSVQSVHLVVMHFNITRQIRAPALIHTDFFSKLSILHLKLTNSVPNASHFGLLLADKLVVCLQFFLQSSSIAIGSALNLSASVCSDLQSGVLFPERFELPFDIN